MKQMILETVTLTNYIAVYATDVKNRNNRVLIAKYYPLGDRLNLAGFFSTTVYEDAAMVVRQIRSIVSEVMSTCRT